MRTWTSLHVWCHGIGPQEDLVTELAPLLDTGENPWFFVKYWYGGPHVRLRWSDPCPHLRHEVEQRVKAFFDGRTLLEADRDRFYAAVSFDGEDLDPSSLPWYANGTVLEVPYVPETERYGSGELMYLSEDAFAASSALAVTVFRSSRSLTTRVALAAVILVRTLTALGILDDAFLRRYTDYWRSIATPLPEGDPLRLGAVIDGAMSSPVLPDSLEPLMTTLINSLLRIRQPLTDDALRYVAASHCHMTNNRLSVTPTYEYQIAHLLRSRVVQGDAA